MSTPANDPESVTDRLLGVRGRPDRVYHTVGRCILIVVVIIFSWRYYAQDMRGLTWESDALHLVDLVFHEAGHILFAIFGNDILTALGGSLMQILVPWGISLAFLISQRDAFGAAVCTWWTGQNFVDCAPYINDARMLQLTLLGGKTGREVHGHDWEFILTQLDLLDQDIYIARGALLIGRVIMVFGIAWCVAVTVRQARLQRASEQSEISSEQ